MRKYLKVGLPILSLIILIIPGYTFFVVNQNLDTATDFTSTLFMVFRLLGLYAFTLIWFQLMLGPLTTPLSKLYGGARILRLHRISGTFAFSLAVLHGLLFYITSFFIKGNFNLITEVSQYVGDDLAFYGYLGPASLTMLLATVTTALMMRNKHFIKIWRKIHLLNYLIFILVFLHSFYVGSDTPSQPLKFLYQFFAITFLVAFYYRVIWRRFLQN